MARAHAADPVIPHVTAHVIAHVNAHVTSQVIDPGIAPPDACARVSAGRTLAMTAVTIVPVVAAVIRRGEGPSAPFLLALRPVEKRHGGLWEFPGGKMAPGESEAEALARELDEELGVALIRCGARLAAFRDPGSVFEIRFIEAEVSGVPEAREHQALRWTTPRASLGLPLAPTDRRFVERILEG